MPPCRRRGRPQGEGGVAMFVQRIERSRRWPALRTRALVVAGLLLCATAPSCASDKAAIAASVDATATDSAVTDGAADASSNKHPSFAWPLDVSGPHNVGHRLTSVTYQGAGGIGSRTIPMHIWYPTAAETGDHPAPYGSMIVDTRSFEDAAVAAPDDGAKWPVMVYSHGHQGFAGSSVFLAWHFASHGWIVAAPDHVGNLLSDAILPRPTWVYYARAFDVSETLNYLEKLDAAAGFGAGVVDTQHTLLLGHSFGAHNCWSAAGATFDAATILADCAEEGGTIVKDDCSDVAMAVFAKGLAEPRVVAAAPLAGTMHRGLNGPLGHEGAKIPVLSMSGTKDLIGADKQFDECIGCDLTWVELKDGTHQSFALSCNAPGKNEKTCSTTMAWTLAFGRRHVLGDAGVVDMLEGVKPHGDVVVTYKRRKP